MADVPKQVLKGKVALVTGAARGAGRGIAIALGEAGATCRNATATPASATGNDKVQSPSNETTAPATAQLPKKPMRGWKEPLDRSVALTESSRAVWSCDSFASRLPLLTPPSMAGCDSVFRSVWPERSLPPVRSRERVVHRTPTVLRCPARYGRRPLPAHQ